MFSWHLQCQLLYTFYGECWPVLQFLSITFRMWRYVVPTPQFVAVGFSAKSETKFHVHSFYMTWCSYAIFKNRIPITLKNKALYRWMIEIQKLCKFNAYSLMSLEIRMYPWNHHHNLCHEHALPTKVFSHPFTLFFIIRTHIRSILLYFFLVYNTLLLTIGIMLTNRPLGLTHFCITET